MVPTFRVVAGVGWVGLGDAVLSLQLTTPLISIGLHPPRRVLALVFRPRFRRVRLVLVLEIALGPRRACLECAGG